MDNIIGFILFISFLSFFVGLIKPSIFSRVFKNKKEINRKFILKVFGSSTFALLLILGMVSENKSDNIDPIVNNSAEVFVEEKAESFVEEIQEDEALSQDELVSANQAEPVTTKIVTENKEEVAHVTNQPAKEINNAKTDNAPGTEIIKTDLTPPTEESEPVQPTKAVVSGKFYTSSHGSAKYYYPASCSDWQNLSQSYLREFDSLESLLKKYPSRTLSPTCN
ncbi:MAG: hypothetical protein JST_000140 [Candidatus Parcubacteria bacterium]